ncbi:uncharacterized protein LOC143233802 isoform X1 [Tachypleus tridentatus]|uniref:uncharacterized protein LOC143233802 isoform X1 n=1 Tax=Tachypleus tridentatus TaxID=6853 RepID=UPI003FD0675C
MTSVRVFFEQPSYIYANMLFRTKRSSSPVRPLMPPVIVDGLPPNLTPYQVAKLIARAKPGATIEPSRTRILRRGGILFQPATTTDQIYLCQPWNTEFKDGTEEKREP